MQMGQANPTVRCILLVRLENVPWMQGERDGGGQCGQVIPFRVPDEWQKKCEHLRGIWEIN